MRVTGPAARRRNHAWLQMRSPERRAARLARLAQRQQQVDDTSDDSDTSGGESDSSLDDIDTSDDESDSSLDGIDTSDDESDNEPTRTARPPIASVGVKLRIGRGAGFLPTPTANAAPAVALGVTGLGEAEDAQDTSSDSDSEDSADESADEFTAPPGNPPTPPAAAPATLSNTSASTPTVSPPGPGNSDSAASPTLPTVSSPLLLVPGPTRGSSPGRDDPAGTSPVASTTPRPLVANTPSPNVPIAGGTQLGGAQDAPPNSQARSDLDPATIAGIVFGVLAFIGILAGAAFLWRKHRRDRGLPFFPYTRLRLRDDDSRPPSVSGPLPGRAANQHLVKTNTQLMDDLMKAAYAADSGGTYGPTAQKLPAHQQEHENGIFLDEKAYVALAGPLTPASPKKPVQRWLDEVKTPTQPHGPETPPTLHMAPPTGLSRAMAGAGGRVPPPQKPAYYGRETMTTETTSTSARWYG